MVLRSKKVGFLEFSDSYAKKKNSGQNSHFFENFVFDFLEKVEKFFDFCFHKNKKFRSKPIFWFLFHQNRTTKKYFLRGCTTVRGGVCGPAMKKFPKSNFNWNSSDFLYCLPRKLGMCIIVVPQTPPTVVHPLKKCFLVVRFS